MAGEAKVAAPGLGMIGGARSVVGSDGRGGADGMSSVLGWSIFLPDWAVGPARRGGLGGKSPYLACSSCGKQQVDKGRLLRSLNKPSKR